MEIGHIDIITQANLVAWDAEKRQLAALADEELQRLINHGAEEERRGLLILMARNRLYQGGYGVDEEEAAVTLRDLLG